MLCLTVRQPWAWLIFNGKDIENRDWPLRHRGELGIHAGKGMTQYEYDDAVAFVRTFDPALAARIPQPADLIRGAILGTVNVTGCVTEHRSPWFMGKYGIVINVRFAQALKLLESVAFAAAGVRSGLPEAARRADPSQGCARTLGVEACRVSAYSPACYGGHCSMCDCEILSEIPMMSSRRAVGRKPRDRFASPQGDWRGTSTWYRVGRGLSRARRPGTRSLSSGGPLHIGVNGGEQKGCRAVAVDGRPNRRRR